MYILVQGSLQENVSRIANRLLEPVWRQGFLINYLRAMMSDPPLILEGDDEEWDEAEDGYADDEIDSD